MFGDGSEETEDIPPEEKPERLDELLDTLPPEAEDEASTLISESDDSEEIIEGLERLIATYSPDSVDDAVETAESLAHLQRMLAADGSIISRLKTLVDRITGNKPSRLRETISDVPAAVESEGDACVRQADSAESLIEDLNDLIEDHYEQQANEVVADADSVSDLRSQLRDEQEPATAEENENSETIVDSIRQRTGWTVSEAQETIENAEPHEAATWGLLAGVAVMNPTFGAPAIAAEYSTAALVSATAVGGTALGAYASSHDDSVLNEVEPVELFASTEKIAAKSKDIDEIDNRTLGIVLGASSHLAAVLTPEEYQQWVTNADAEAVLEGAAHGVRYAQSEELGMTSHGGATLGAGLGLLHSYAEAGNSTDQLQHVLADDLWEDYQRQLED